MRFVDDEDIKLRNDLPWALAIYAVCTAIRFGVVYSLKPLLRFLTPPQPDDKPPLANREAAIVRRGA